MRAYPWIGWLSLESVALDGRQQDARLARVLERHGLVDSQSHLAPRFLAVRMGRACLWGIMPVMEAAHGAVMDRRNARPVVILADDDAAITSNLAPFLERSGLTVHVAADGQAVLDLVERLDPDGCVLDVLMPRLDGREVLRRLRADGRWLPVVLLTQVGESTERAIALEEGADDYLNKPFDPYELLARLRAVMRRARPGRRPLSASAVLRAGDLRMDRISRRAWLRDAGWC